jgi:hypothetical protein
MTSNSNTPESPSLQLAGERLKQVQKAADEINQLAASIVELATDIIASSPEDGVDHHAEAIRSMAKLASLKADLIARALGDPGITPFAAEFQLAA